MVDDDFTIKEIVIEIRDDVRSLSANVTRIDREGSIGTKQELKDHEGRLRKLETVASRWSGTLAFITSLAAISIGTFAALHGG